MDQNLINLVFTVCGALAGFFMKLVWDSIKELQKTDSELKKSVYDINLLVVGEFARRVDIAQIFEELKAIRTLLDKKADKP